jgi:hypothetical protein
MTHDKDKHDPSLLHKALMQSIYNNLHTQKPMPSGLSICTNKEQF